MVGASDATRRVAFINANRHAERGYEVMLVTEDGERIARPTTAADVTAFSQVAANGGVFLWDPEGETLIIANVLGEWIPPA